MGILKLGDKGVNVRFLQISLNTMGFRLKVDGDFGPKTEEAVKAFQEQRGLISDGIAGPATKMYLNCISDLLRDNEDLQYINMGIDKKIHSSDPTTNQVIKSIVNYGTIINKISEMLMIEPAIAHAIVSLESAGEGMVFGKMLIRFEAHVFWRKWGKYYPSLFNKFFSFDKEFPWKKQTWMGKPYHGNQKLEWEAFYKAQELCANAAYESISMGLGQIMGFHWSLLDYSNPQDMFNHQNQGEREQLLTLFDYISCDPEILTAVQEKDWYTFAYHYNGPGQPETYAEKLIARYTISKQILEDEGQLDD